MLIDVTHTSHTRARTGVQRVVRSLREALGSQVTSVCFDPNERTWRALEAWEQANLDSSESAPTRKTHWPLSAQVRGLLRRKGLLPRSAPLAKNSGPVLVPEIFSRKVGNELPRLFEATSGPRVALFHDAIALQLPDYTPPSNVARFPEYMRDLLRFDGVAAVSESSRAALVGYWRWLGANQMPPVIALPLGVDAPLAPYAAPPARELRTVLCVSTIEPRKNHLALLEACEVLWEKGLEFRLHLIGMANRESGQAVLDRIRNLQEAGRPLEYNGPVSDAALDAAYARSTFTVYPSLAEGFGLPIAESLTRGRPCLCRWDSALGEIARGGGCAGLGSASAAEITATLGRILGSSSELNALTKVARSRTFRTWQQYAAELIAWAGTLKRGASA